MISFVQESSMQSPRPRSPTKGEESSGSCSPSPRINKRQRRAQGERVFRRSRERQNYLHARMREAEEALVTKKKEKPSFELSRKLAEEANRYKGITLLFNEPKEARKPNQRWRLSIFKDGKPMNEPLYLHRQSCYLFGRERRVVDIPTDHPSCSKQHAVIQYREVKGKVVRPYIMDLGSTNNTYLNDSPIDSQRCYELFEKDTIKFGESSREYVLLHENSD